MAELFLSIETTGIGSLNPPKQRLLSVSWNFSDCHHEYYILCNHQISPNVKHSITTNDIQNGTEFIEVLTKLFKQLKECDVLVCHNIDFCIQTLLYECKCRDVDRKRLKKVLQGLNTSDGLFCTMKHSVKLCKIQNLYGYKFPTLNEIECRLFGETYENEQKPTRLKSIYETLEMMNMNNPL